jgi:hypothetical protein
VYRNRIAHAKSAIPGVGHAVVFPAIARKIKVNHSPVIIIGVAILADAFNHARSYYSVDADFIVIAFAGNLRGIKESQSARACQTND